MNIKNTGIKEAYLNDDGTLKIICNLYTNNQKGTVIFHKVFINTRNINIVPNYGHPFVELLPYKLSCAVIPVASDNGSKVYLDIITEEESSKEMSIQEIEEKLGHKIKIISK